MELGRYIFQLPSDEELQVLEQKINYSFSNRTLLREALQPATWVNEDGNKKLAMVGNSIMRLVIVNHGLKGKKTRGMCFSHTGYYFTNLRFRLWLGQISDMFTLKASKSSLCAQGFYLGISKFVVKRPTQLVVGPTIMATTMEAIVGAVYLDCNEQIQPCAVVMNALDIAWSE
ncbi:Ribonuclease III domain [Penicillium roqueforti FM164]|uniref:Ribonuclease III domain n=1 Tax=Penicillium roqueforti (strain FM164) TaxID=1365484 RepID=W6R7L1_PENRF|nr:Ribonuclease III domain [Penicillium roqueforti FM164]